MGGLQAGQGVDEGEGIREYDPSTVAQRARGGVGVPAIYGID